MAKVLDFNAALKAKQAKRPVAEVAGQLALDTKASHGFYPEDGERANPTKPIYGQFIYSKYAIDWRQEHDADVRAFCKKNRIQLDSVALSEPGTALHAPFGIGVQSWHALVTPKSYSKLEAAGMVTTKFLN